MQFKSEDATSATQLVLVSATIPKDWMDKVSDYVEPKSFRVAKSDQLHQVMRHVRQRFFRLHKHDRPEQLIYECKHAERRRQPTLIFTNTTDASSWACHFLNENGVSCAHLCKSMTNEQRIAHLQRFQRGECDFLACTDIASRGIDTVRVRS